jgi:tRNA pseudouridine32 synthase/23S rRNA pseudouridine746 synthase
VKKSLGKPYQSNRHIYYYRFLENEIVVPFEHQIVFENDDLLVVDKPHFLTMTPTGQYVQQTLLVRLKQQTGNAELTPIHRLDRETAGIVLFSKRPETRGVYQQLFATRQIEKIYHAIAPTVLTSDFPSQLGIVWKRVNLSTPCKLLKAQSIVKPILNF